ncbi:MAG: hypothetical protein DI629_10085 [Mesorhizobium amorphae]|nr:MAG: hypothetical protein DI629_10085 [Mesorhizobium amorphae]
MRFDEILAAYWLEGRTLVAVVGAGGAVALRLDLYHCDDAKRCRDGVEYLLDIAVPGERLRVERDLVERLGDSFSADVLAAEIVGDELRLLVDYSFYGSKTQLVGQIVLSGGEADVVEHPPALVQDAPVPGAGGRG